MLNTSNGSRAACLVREHTGQVATDLHANMHAIESKVTVRMLTQLCMAAGFHNSSLYEALRVSIGPLVALLRDEEDKTRANAAGALGNLVRNSGLLWQALIEAHALQVCRCCNAGRQHFPADL